MNDQTQHSLCPYKRSSRLSLAVVNFKEDGRPVKGVRVTIKPSSLPEVDLECAILGFQTLELITDEAGYAEHPLVCGSVVDVSVSDRNAVQTIRVPDGVESFELIGYPPVQ